MAAKFKHDAMMKKFNIEMRARTIAAPTNDKEVKEQLRNFEEPICLFGEGPSERRDRLKNILAKLEVCLTPLPCASGRILSLPSTVATR
mgnify:CR=1 FL=1|jgi:hypothetical protein